MTTKQLWINPSSLKLESPKLFACGLNPMNISYGLTKGEQSVLFNYYDKYITNNNLDPKEFLIGPVLQFLTTISQGDFFDSNDKSASLIALQGAFHTLFPEQNVPHVKGYRLEDVSFPYILERVPVIVQSIQLLASNGYEDMTIQEMMHPIVNLTETNPGSAHNMLMTKIDILFQYNLLIYLISFLHAGEVPITDLPPPLSITCTSKLIYIKS